MNPDIFAAIGIFLIIADLAVAGIIGIRRKEIHSKRIFMGLMLLPLGIIGRIMHYFRSDAAPDTGNAAVSSGIAAIAVGIFIAIFFGFYYADRYKVIPYELIKVLVPVLLILLILGIPASILILRSRP